MTPGMVLTTTKKHALPPLEQTTSVAKKAKVPPTPGAGRNNYQTIAVMEKVGGFPKPDELADMLKPCPLEGRFF